MLRIESSLIMTYVREHYKVQIPLQQIGFFSAYAVFGITYTATEKIYRASHSKRRCYRKKPYEVPRERRSHQATVWSYEKFLLSLSLTR